MYVWIAMACVCMYVRVHTTRHELISDFWSLALIDSELNWFNLNPPNSNIGGNIVLINDGNIYVWYTRLLLSCHLIILLQIPFECWMLLWTTHSVLLKISCSYWSYRISKLLLLCDRFSYNNALLLILCY